MIDLKKGVEIGEACDKCGAPMLKRVGKFGPFIACSAYPECTNTREVETQEPEPESGEEEIEPCENCGKPMARQARPVRAVPRLLGLPRMQDDAEAHRQQAGRAHRRQARPDPRGALPEVQREPGGEAGPLRRVHRVHPLSRVQVRQAQDDGPACARRTPTRAARSSSGSRSAASRSSAARITPTATSCSGTGRSSSPARSATPRTWSRRSPRSSAAQLLCNNEDCDYARSEELPESAA